MVLLLLAASVIQASQANDNAQGRFSRVHPDHRGLVQPEIGVLIAPRTQRWQGNYRPNGYRLDDYDGVPRPPIRCAGRSGTTISTSDIDCPPGQTPVEGSRRWSTQPFD